MHASIDMDEVHRLERQLERFANRGIPHAARNGLNAAAFAGRGIWHGHIDREMTTRNTWTKRSVRVDKARGTNMRRMEAILGSIAEYMERQETGGTLHKEHKHGVPIPTSVSSGEGRGARPRRRLVRRPHRLPNIQLARRGRAGQRKQRNAASIRQALAAGRKHVYLELENVKGLFRIRGGKRRPKFDLLWDLSEPSVRIPATGTLGKTLRSIEPMMPGLMVEAIKKQLAFHANR